MPVSPAPVWQLSYGWNYSPNPFNPSTAGKRPTHIESIPFHSLESALKYPSRGTWWEITSPSGEVVMASVGGFSNEVCPNPSLCARQILNTRYPGSFPEVAEAVENERTHLDQASHDDGATWRSVLLGAKDQTPKNEHTKSRAVRLCIVGVFAGPDDRITIQHATGRMAISPQALEIKQRAGGTYDLWVLGTPRGVYAKDIGEDAAMAARALGVTVAGDGDPCARKSTLPKMWKPGLVRIAQKHEGNGNGTGDTSALTYREVRGFVRGTLGVDRRSANITNSYNPSFTYQKLLWHLTHNPTGSLIVRCKTRAQVEEIADLLREEIPELTDGEGEVTEEMGRRARDVIEQTEIHRW